MGEVNKPFCDGCKKEITPATWSKDGRTGVVKYKVAVWVEGAETSGLVADLDLVCHDKIMTWLQGKANAAASDWSTDAPTVKNLTMPTL